MALRSYGAPDRATPGGGGPALGGTEPSEVFAAVARAASALIDGYPTSLLRFEEDGDATIVAVRDGQAPPGVRIPGDGDGVTARVWRTGRAARIDDYAEVRTLGHAADWGLRAAVGVPVPVDGRPWGLLVASSGDLPLPAGTEDRLATFTEIIAAAIAGADAREALRDVADEQAALRRVAELVARGADAAEVFAAVAREASGLVHEDTTLLRIDGGRTYTVVAEHGGPAPVGTRVQVPPNDEGVVAEILRTRRPARLDDYRVRGGRAYARDDYGVGSGVGVPIIVDDGVWGVLGATTEGRRLPPGTEHRLGQFAELVVAALANVQARADAQALADEQSALRRVAELVAHGAALEEVFAAVASEASTLLGNLAAALLRYEPDGWAVAVATHRSPAPLGLRIRSDGDSGTGLVLRTGRPARVDSFAGTTLAEVADRLGVGAGVAVPVVVEGRVWGALTTSSPGPPLPAGTEDRLAPFAELAAAAIANAENKAKLTASRARVVATADETRRRLQRDVHDSAQQRLVHTIITLKLTRDALAAGQDPSDLVEESLRNAERASRELRDVVRGILPAALTRSGLRAGLESLVDDLLLPVDLRVAVPRLPARLETTAYFVVAEALTNAVKHAGARRAEVTVVLEGADLVVDVRDDGQGGADPARGSGLTGLLDRVEANEGRLTLSSPAGGGTALRAVLPLPPEVDA
jgi:signal transduction histidine kinase